MNRPTRLLGALLVSALAIGCVSQNSYDEVVAEKDGLTQELASTQQDITKTTADLDRTSDTLKNTSANLTLMTGERDLLTRQLNQTTQTLSARTTERNTLQSNLEAATTELTSTKSVLNDAQNDLDRSRQDVLTLSSQLSAKTEEWTSSGERLTQVQGLYDTLQTQVNEAQPYWDVAVAYLHMSRLGGVPETTQGEAVAAVLRVSVATEITGDQILINAWNNFGATLTNAALAEFLFHLLSGLEANAR